MFKAIKRQIAEWFFEDILDDDFRMGIGHGADVMVKAIIFRLKVIRNEDVKKNNPGLDKAIESLEELRREDYRVD